MSEQNFEKLFYEFAGNVEDGRLARLNRNMQVLECDMQQSLRLDRIQTELVRGVLKLVGFACDQLAELPNGARGAAMTQLISVVAYNMSETYSLAAQVGLYTTTTGELLTPNPSNSTCNCENCNLVRALSAVMLPDG